jgi:hypothetical protein
LLIWTAENAALTSLDVLNNFTKWFRNARGRPPEEVYVDFAEAPDEADGPYRARMALSTHVPVVEGMDVNEREVVAGEWQADDQIYCPCGHRWQVAEFQRMSVCPQCNRAVLVAVPTSPAA